MHEPVGLLQFVVFEKFASAYLFQIVPEKSFDYLLINNYTSDNFCHASVFYMTNEGNSYMCTSTLLDKNLTCEFKRKNPFTLSKTWMKTEKFLLTVKSSLNPQLNIEELDHKAKENLTSLRIRCGFFSDVFRVVEKLWAVFTPRRNYSTQHKLLKPKCREAKLKSTRKRIFWALKDIYLLLLVADWLLHWTLNRLD